MSNRKMLAASLLCSFFFILISSGCGNSTNAGSPNAQSHDSSINTTEIEMIEDSVITVETTSDIWETGSTETATDPPAPDFSYRWTEDGYQYLRHQLKSNTWVETTMNGSVYSYVNLYYNALQLGRNPIQEGKLDEILLSHGIEPAVEAEYIEDELISMCALSEYCYTLDLYAVEPIIATEDHKIICKLKTDDDSTLLFMLEIPEGTPQASPTKESSQEPGNDYSEVVPQKVYYYVGPEWNPELERVSFLINGTPATEEESMLCEKLFEAHIDKNSYSISAVLDGRRSYDIVTVIFLDKPGLEYHFYVYNYHFNDSPGLEVYCRPRNTSVFIPIESIESIGGQFSD